MQDLKINNVIIFALFCAFLFTGCKKEIETHFELNDVELYPSSAEKNKLKTNEQFIAILYANLFQTSMPANDIFDLNNCIESIGDKELAREVIISNFMNNEGVIMPTTEEMNANIDQFINDTYVRFFVRFPTESELTFTRNFIQSNPYMTPELVYFSFTLSDEYLYY